MADIQARLLTQSLIRRLTTQSSVRASTVEPPDGWTSFDVWAGAFSPDGTTIAVPVRRSIATGDSEPDLQLALIDLENGAVTAVEQSEVKEGYNFVAWTFSGEYVFLTGGQRFKDRSISVYRMGDPAAERLDVDVGDFYRAAAI